jgi:RNA polymerase sigma-70 factor (ECF subfamily)
MTTEAETTTKNQNRLNIETREDFLNLTFDEQLRLRHYMLRNPILRNLPNDLADDLVSEAVMKAVIGIDQYKDNTNFLRWISTILSRQFLNYFRIKNRLLRPMLYSELNSEGEPFKEADFERSFWQSEQSNNPADIISKKEIDSKLAEALSEIYGDHTRRFVMYSVEEQEYREIAHLEGVPLGTVRSGISRARHAIQMSLEQSSQNKGGIEKN